MSKYPVFPSYQLVHFLYHLTKLFGFAVMACVVDTCTSSITCLFFDLFTLAQEMESHSKDVEVTPLCSNSPLLATFSTVLPHTVIYHSHAGFLLHSAASYKVV